MAKLKKGYCKIAQYTIFINFEKYQIVNIIMETLCNISEQMCISNITHTLGQKLAFIRQ